MLRRLASRGVWAGVRAYEAAVQQLAEAGDHEEALAVLRDFEAAAGERDKRDKDDRSDKDDKDDKEECVIGVGCIHSLLGCLAAHGRWKEAVSLLLRLPEQSARSSPRPYFLRTDTTWCSTRVAWRGRPPHGRAPSSRR